MKRLDGRVAIVTGGASGIGAATVRRLAEEGAAVVSADVQDESGEKGATALRDVGLAVDYRHCDVTSLAEVEALVDFAVKTRGGLDVLFNNAATSGGGYVADIDPDVWESSLRVMLTAVWYGMRAAIPRMLERGGGSIISTASVEGLFGERVAAPYCTAKAGVINLSRTAAIEYGRKNIRVNAICPGVVETPMFERVLAMGLRTREQVADMHALGRTLQPQEIANLVLFLASDESSAITGQAIVIDGGLTSGLSLTGFPPVS